MKSNLFKTFVFLSFICLSILSGSINSFAQNNSSNDADDDIASDATEQKIQNAIDQIQNSGFDSNDNSSSGASKYKNALSLLDSAYADTEASAEKSANIDKITIQNTSVQQAPAQKTVSTQPINNSQQTTSTPEIKPGPVNVLPQPPIKRDSVTNLNKPTQYQFSLESSGVVYKEPHLMSEKGPYFGVYGAIEKRLDVSDIGINVVHLDAHLNYGLVDYKSGSTKIKDISDRMFEPRVWFGKDIPWGPSAQFTPYAGIGYRYLFDGLSKGINGYDRRSQYLYMPFGLETEFQLPHGWQIRLNTEYDFFIRGWQTSYLSDANPAFPDLQNTQRSGYGLKGSLDFVKSFGKFDFLISPYIRYWYIKQSDPDTATSALFIISGVEPNNNSTETGLRFTIEY